MAYKDSYYDITAPAKCDTPSQVLELLTRNFDNVKLRAGNDEGMMRLRISAQDPLKSTNGVFNVLSTAMSAAGYENGEPSLSQVRRGMGDAVVLCSTELDWVLQKLRVAMRKQIHPAAQ